MDIIQDASRTPGMQAVTNSIAEPARRRWLSLTTYIEQTYSAKPQIAYSRCSAKPGWNVKYKKSGKALCTLYPEPESFTALIVTGPGDMEKYTLMRPLFSDETNALYDSAPLFNNTKWLMIGVSGDDALDDIKRLLQLKTGR